MSSLFPGAQTQEPGLGQTTVIRHTTETTQVVAEGKGNLE